MAADGDRHRPPFSSLIGAIDKWRLFNGAVDSDGNEVTMPPLLARAVHIETLARRYGCTPVEIVRHPAWIETHLAVLKAAGFGE